MQERLCALKGLLRAVYRLEDSMRDAFGVTLTEALCLCTIGGGCVSAGTLSEELSLSPSRLSRVLFSLEAKGLLERRRRTDDRRSWDLLPTENGKELVERIRVGIDIPEEISAFMPV